jgi:protein-tyrosine-phosphatase
MYKCIFVCAGGVARSQTLAVATKGFLEQKSISGDADIGFAGIDTEKIRKNLRRFCQKYGCFPEEYLKQHEFLPHILKDERGRLYADFNIDQEEWVGAAPDFWTPLNNEGWGEEAGRLVRRPITIEDVANSDAILPVTRQIKREIESRFKQDEKIQLATEFAGLNCKNPDIEDPYDLSSDGIYTNLEGVRFNVGNDRKYNLAKQTHLTAIYAIPDIFLVAKELAIAINEEIINIKK